MNDYAPGEPLRRKISRRILLATTLISALAAAGSARDLSPGFFDQSLPLPGMPAAVLSADMTGDGIEDLVILVAYRTWDDVSTVEQTTFDDIEGMVEGMTVVTALLDKRELRVYPGREGMGFDASLPALELDTSVHALATGHPAEPLIAITDQGVAAVRGFDGAGGAPALEPLLELETSLTGSGSFYSQLSFLEDLDGDGLPDLLLPTATGWVVYAGTPDGFEARPSATLTEPEPESRSEDDEGEDHDKSENDDDDGRPPHPRHRLPTVRDVSGDGLLDLLVLNAGRRRSPVVYLGTGELRFGAPIEIELAAQAAEDEEIVFLGDLDGDASPELVSQQEHELPDDAGWRQEVAEAKRPHFTYRLYRLDQDLAVAKEPHHTFQAIGYTFEGQEEDAQEEPWKSSCREASRTSTATADSTWSRSRSTSRSYR